MTMKLTKMKAHESNIHIYYFYEFEYWYANEHYNLISSKYTWIAPLYAYHNGTFHIQSTYVYLKMNLNVQMSCVLPNSGYLLNLLSHWLVYDIWDWLEIQYISVMSPWTILIMWRFSIAFPYSIWRFSTSSRWGIPIYGEIHYISHIWTCLSHCDITEMS